MPAVLKNPGLKRTLQRLTFNLKATGRSEKLAGRDCLVVPMVMLTEGVHAGDGGPLLYTGRDVRNYAPFWNHSPIVVYHPTSGDSARVPVVLNNQQVGVVLNTTPKKSKSNGLVKLHAEAWLYADRLDEVDERVRESVEHNKMMEVSTGLWTFNENKAGNWNGEDYIAIARNYAPDHLALLPDREGACSIADGAGFLRLNQATNQPEGRRLVQHVMAAVEDRLKLTINGLSFSDITNKLREALGAKYGTKGRSWGGWVADVFDTFVVFYDEGGKLKQQTYSMAGDGVNLSGDARAVQVQTSYVAVSNNTKKEPNMAKTASKVKKGPSREDLIAAAITNEATPWTEEDKTFLMGLDERRLGLVLAENEAGDEEEEEEDPKPTPAKNAKKTTTPVKRGRVANEADTEEKEEEEKPPVKNHRQPTFNELLEAADPEDRAAWEFGQQAYREKVGGLIKTIVANKAFAFTKEELGAMDIATLQKLAAAATVGRRAQEPKLPAQLRLADVYAGAGGPVENEAVEIEPLASPTMNEAGDEEEEEEETPKRKKKRAS